MKKLLALLFVLLLPFSARAEFVSSGSAGGGGGGTPGGTNLQVQYNNNGAFGGVTRLPILNGGPNVANRPPTPLDDWSSSYFGDGSVDNLTITTTGTCTVTPTIVIGAPAAGGIQATAHFVMNGTSTFWAAIDTPGRGYTANPTVTFSGGTCSVNPVVQAYYTPNGQMWNYKGQIYQAHQSDTGVAVWSEFVPATYAADAVVNGVTAATISGGSGGINYATNDHITLANGTVLNVSGQSAGVITTVTIVTPGNWHCYTASAQAQVSTTGSGTGATFVLTANWAMGLYGDHLLTSCYAGNKYADITRASDSTTATIGFIGTQADLPSMQQFCAGTTCTFTKLYDQSGRANDAPSGSAPVLDFGQSINGFPAWFGGYFVMPVGVAYKASTMAAYMLSRSEVLSNFMFQAGININQNCGGFGGNACIRFQNPASGFVVLSSNTLDYTPALVGGTLRSTTDAEYSINDFEYSSTATVSNGANQTGGNIGGSSNSGMAANMFAIWPRGFTTAEVAAFRAAVYASYSITPQVRDRVQTAGDSRTNGQNSTNNVNYPLQMEPHLLNIGRVVGTGVNGSQLQAQTITNCYSGYGDCVAMSQPHTANSWVVLWTGYNDFNSGGVSAGALNTSLTSWVSIVHSFGWKAMVVVDPDVASYQTMFRANAYGADNVCDYTLDPVWGANNWASQTFQNYPHPYTFGYGYIGNDTASCLNALLQ